MTHNAAQHSPVRAAGTVLSAAPALSGFEHVERLWDAQLARYVVRVGPGEVYASTNDELITTTLGSCISACIRDPVAAIGGMNHFMLPSAEKNLSLRAAASGIYAMELLLNTLYKHGGSRRRLEVKLFGGSQMLLSETNVGNANTEFIREFLCTEGITIAAEDLGSSHSRKVRYFPATGKVWVKRLDTKKAQQLIHDETRYLDDLLDAPGDNEITLF